MSARRETRGFSVRAGRRGGDVHDEDGGFDSRGTVYWHLLGAASIDGVDWVGPTLNDRIVRVARLGATC